LETGQDLRQGKIGSHVDLPELTELRDELRPHQYTNDDKIIRVTPKNPGRGAKVGQSIKELLGRSPDRADCFVIARWVNAGSGDPQNDQSRIAFSLQWHDLSRMSIRSRLSNTRSRIANIIDPTHKNSLGVLTGREFLKYGGQ
jgi:hypothetical protein